MNAKNPLAKKSPAKVTSKSKPDVKKPDSNPDSSHDLAQQLQDTEAGAAKGNDDQSNQQTANDEGTPQYLNSHRVKVAELATQLVAAQINAHASYQAAVDVAKEQRELVAEALEALAAMFKLSPAPKQESAATQEEHPIPPEIQQMIENMANEAAEHPDASGTDMEMEAMDDPEQEAAAKQVVSQIRIDRLKYSIVHIRKPLELKPLSSSELDLLFAAAMYRSQQMLMAPEQDSRAVWAEQIFAPDESITENQIFERFKQWKWPDLSSRPSVIALMESVDRWISQYDNRLRVIGSGENRNDERHQENEEAEALARVLDLCERRTSEGLNSHRRAYASVADAIKDFLRTRNARVVQGMTGRTAGNMTRNLIAMLLGQSASPSPDAVLETPSPATKVRRTRRNYRPWGIFRFLRLYAGKEGDEDGKAIIAKIRTRRCDLDPRQLVNVLSVCPPEFEFGPISAEMEELMEASYEEEMESPQITCNSTLDYADDSLPF